MARGGVRGGAYKMRPKVVKYWAPILWLRKGFYSELEFSDPGTCFACTWVYPIEETQVAHILAKRDGGSDNVDNLHILCIPCHHDSEYLSRDRYWDWFYTRTQMDGLIRHFMARGGSIGGLFTD